MERCFLWSKNRLSDETDWQKKSVSDCCDQWIVNLKQKLNWYRIFLKILQLSSILSITLSNSSCTTSTSCQIDLNWGQNLDFNNLWLEPSLTRVKPDSSPTVLKNILYCFYYSQMKLINLCRRDAIFSVQWSFVRQVFNINSVSQRNTFHKMKDVRWKTIVRSLEESLFFYNPLSYGEKLLGEIVQLGYAESTFVLRFVEKFFLSSSRQKFLCNFYRKKKTFSFFSWRKIWSLWARLCGFSRTRL